MMFIKSVEVVPQAAVADVDSPNIILFYNDLSLLSRFWDLM